MVACAAYYGAKYPSIHFEAKKVVCGVIKEALLPALIESGYTGPAGMAALAVRTQIQMISTDPLLRPGIDVMFRPPHPPHFVELNMRTDAITYMYTSLATRCSSTSRGLISF
jgi:hypothetical protein